MAETHGDREPADDGWLVPLELAPQPAHQRVDGTASGRACASPDAAGDLFSGQGPAALLDEY